MPCYSAHEDKRIQRESECVGTDSFILLRIVLPQICVFLYPALLIPFLPVVRVVGHVTCC
jgi:hypothetical protein